MKVELENKPKKIEPITLTITIETEQELCSLWHRLNLSPANINKYSDCLMLPAKQNTELFNALDNLVEQHKLKL